MTTQSIKPKKLLGQLVKVFPAFLFIFTLLFSAYTLYHVTGNLLDSDASSEMVLANLLSQENAVITTDWFYSTEIRVLYMGLIFAPLFHVFTSWHMVRFVGALVMWGILLLSYLYLCRRMKLGNRAFFYTASLWMAPYSVAYGRAILFHNHYLPFVAISLLMVGLFLSVLEHGQQPEAPTKKWLRVSALLLLAFCSCLSGLRQIMLTMVPLLVAAVLRFARVDKQSHPNRSAAYKVRGKEVLLALCVCLAGALGYLVNTQVLSLHYSFKSFEQTTLGFSTAEGIREILLGYLTQFGFQEGRTLFSLEGILACGGIFVALFLVFQGARALLARQDNQNDAVAYVQSFFPLALLVMTAVFLFTSDNPYYQLYYLPVAVWAVPFLGSLISHSPVKPRDMTAKKGFLIITCMVMLANGYYNNAYFLNPDDKQVTYDGLLYRETRIVQKLEGAKEFLLQNGYTLGYSFFWNAAVLTEMTDGHIGMVNIVYGMSNMGYAYDDWLAVKHYRDEEFVEQQKVFLLLTHEENGVFSQTEYAGDATLQYEDDFCCIYTFDSPLYMWEDLMITDFALWYGENGD